MSQAVLEVQGVTKSFPGVLALDHVDFRVVAGEIHALLGENGAGKSTLIKILTGIHGPDAGTVRLRGEPVTFPSAHAAISSGISAVHQERNLIPRMSVGENIMLERLPARLGLVDYAAVHADASRWLQRLGLEIDPRTAVRRLSVAQMQLVEIAKALVLEARILLMDEPTASITPHETDVLFTLLRQLRDAGVAIVFVSHKLEEVFDLCDHVTVLRDGRNACVGAPLEGLDRADLVRHMIGRDEQVARLGHRPAPTAEPILEVEGLRTTAGHDGIDLDLRRGEILGLYGLVGAGRSELAKALIGLEPITGGNIEINGAPVTIDAPGTALKAHRLGYISEDRKSEGLILIHDVGRNIAVTIWQKLASVLGFLTERKARAAVTPLVEKLQIRITSLAQITGNLSGGNQQKVSVAKWLAAEVDMLIVDEPTVGIDVQTKAYLHELIWQLAGQGKAVLLISSDMPEMITLADRILVLGDFRILAELANDRDYGRMSARIMAAIHAQEEVNG